ncbi:MAG: hypothetical protein R6V44_13800 [Paracoccaceae bacterium]
MTPAEALILVGLAGAVVAAGAAAAGGRAPEPRPVRAEDDRDPPRRGRR